MKSNNFNNITKLSKTALKIIKNFILNKTNNMFIITIVILDTKTKIWFQNSYFILKVFLFLLRVFIFYRLIFLLHLKGLTFPRLFPLFFLRTNMVFSFLFIFWSFKHFFPHLHLQLPLFWNKDWVGRDEKTELDFTKVHFVIQLRNVIHYFLFWK